MRRQAFIVGTAGILVGCFVAHAVGKEEVKPHHECAYNKADGSPGQFTFAVDDCKGCSAKNPIWEKSGLDPNDYHWAGCFFVDPSAGKKANTVEVQNHIKFCQLPRPTDDYDKCKTHCEDVEENGESCRKECHGEAACEGSCGGICNASDCRKSCEGAENDRRDARAREIAATCYAGRPGTKGDCHDWCNSDVARRAKDCIEACAGRSACNDSCNGACTVKACRDGCNGMADSAPKRRESTREPRGGR